MPNRDSTGPEGKGPKTGRQLGNCGNTQPEEFQRGRGMGRGFNQPRRFRNQRQ